MELAPPDYTSPCTIASGNCAENYGKFFGRGALQMTCWGGSCCSTYSDAGEVYSEPTICQDPDLMATNPVLAWGGSILFYMTNPGVGNQGPAIKWPKQGSFGGTYATINGALECPPGNPQGVDDPRVANRIKNFKAACSAAGVNCDDFDMACPNASAGGTCSLKTDWACKCDADCGLKTTGGVCNIAANKGTCAGKSEWACWQNADCGQSGPCNLPANKGTCAGNPAWACWKDPDCGQSGPCNLPNLGICYGNKNWGCRKDTDCGQSAPCELTPPGASVCEVHTDWACWKDSDCGSSDTCSALPNSGICRNQPSWGCRDDRDCGDGGICDVAPGPTGVPVCSTCSSTSDDTVLHNPGHCKFAPFQICYDSDSCGQAGPCLERLEEALQISCQQPLVGVSPNPELEEEGLGTGNHSSSRRSIPGLLAVIATMVIMSYSAM